MGEPNQKILRPPSSEGFLCVAYPRFKITIVFVNKKGRFTIKLLEISLHQNLLNHVYPNQKINFSELNCKKVV
jgi:hypothetical protein